MITHWWGNGDLGKIPHLFGRNEAVKVALVSALHGRVPMLQEGAEIEMRILLAPLLKLEFSIQHSDRPAGRLPLGRKLQTIGVKKWSASIMADG